MTTTKTASKTASKTDLTREFNELLKKESETWYELAVLAKRLYYEEEWRKKGYDNPKEYVEKEFNGRISYEIFMHRVKMGEAIEKFKIRKDEVIRLGWTKFKEIALVGLIAPAEEFTRDNMLRLIEEAKNKSYREIADFTRKERLKYTRGHEGNKIAKITFKLTDEQDNIVKEALATAMAILERDNPVDALIYICSEWLTNHSEDSTIANIIRSQIDRVKEGASSTTVKHKEHANKKARKEKIKTNNNEEAIADPFEYSEDENLKELREKIDAELRGLENL